MNHRSRLGQVSSFFCIFTYFYCLPSRLPVLMTICLSCSFLVIFFQVLPLFKLFIHQARCFHLSFFPSFSKPGFVIVMLMKPIVFEKTMILFENSLSCNPSTSQYPPKIYKKHILYMYVHSTKCAPPFLRFQTSFQTIFNHLPSLFPSR